MFQFPISKFQGKSGFTLIEAVVGIAVFLIISLTLFSLFATVFGTIRNNKARIVANGIAMEQLEVIRGMNYDNVKTNTGWVPAGPIPSERTMSRSGVNFTVQMDIGPEDDSYDGLFPADTFSLDYKKARVRVSWTNSLTRAMETVAMSTNVVPPGMEGLAEGMGGIFIKTFNASGQAVSNAVVDVTNAAKGYSSLGNLTDLNGNLFILDLDPSTDAPAGNYHIEVSKAGYNSDQTYAVDNNPASPTYNPNPIKPDSVVVDGELTQIGFAIDLTSDINIRTLNYNNPQNWQVNELQANSQTEVDLDIDSNDNIILVWLDDRQGGGNVDRIYAQKYKYNSGTGAFDKQWANDIDITNSNNRENPRVAVYGTNYFYAIWNNVSAGNEDVYLKKFNSADGSSAWGSAKVNLESGNADQIKSDLAADSAGNVYAAWMDDRNGDWDIYAQKRSGANGASLWGSDLKVNGDAGSADQINPRIAVDDEDNLYVVWEDARSGNKDVYWMKFDPDGNKLAGAGEFGASEKMVNSDSSGLDQYEPAIDFDGNGYFYIAWSDKRNSQPDIYARKFDKNGDVAASGNWLSGDVIINDDSLPTAWREKPSVIYSSVGSVLYFSWEDERNGSPDVYSTKFDVDGNRLWTYDLIMNGISSGAQGNPEVVADSQGYAITAWEDNQAGDYNIYAARYKDLGSFIRSNVPIIVHGAKIKGTYPTDNPIYKFTDTPTSGGKLFTSDSSGNIAISGIEWDNYEFITSGGYTIISTDQPIPLVVNPGETGASAKTIVINVEP